MNSHKHGRLTACGRELLCQRVLERSWKVRDASDAAGVSERTAYKWLARYRAEVPTNLTDRSSRPKEARRPPVPSSASTSFGERRSTNDLR